MNGINGEDHSRLEAAREKYFGALGRRFPEAMALHKKRGLLDDPSWKNVVGHCFLETARVEVLAELLKLPAPLARDLALAAAVHDFYKREEVAAIQKDLEAGGTGFEASVQASREASAILLGEGFPKRVVEFLELVGGYPEVLAAIHERTLKTDLSDEEIATLAIHYIDDITRGDLWAAPAERRDGLCINELDRREAKNNANPNYHKIRQETEKKLAAYPFAAGKNGFRVMTEVSHAIERRLTPLIEARSAVKIDPIDLPEYIDTVLKTRILESQ